MGGILTAVHMVHWATFLPTEGLGQQAMITSLIKEGGKGLGRSSVRQVVVTQALGSEFEFSLWVKGKVGVKEQPGIPAVGRQRHVDSWCSVARPSC